MEGEKEVEKQRDNPSTTSLVFANLELHMNSTGNLPKTKFPSVSENSQADFFFKTSKHCITI